MLTSTTVLWIRLVLFTLVLFLSFVTPAYPQDNSWNGITPLRSTRADVEKIFGKPDRNSVGTFTAMYQTSSGRVFVLYSTGACYLKPSHGWNVPALTVISMSVYPIPEPNFDESKIDKTKFVKRPDPEILSEVAYPNEKDGVSVSVNSWDQVMTRYHYFPESKYNNLKCKPD